MTHKDIYEKFMIEYDKANITSSYPSLTKYEVATLLDKAYLALIAQKLTGNNQRKVPFENDIKSIEDLRPLIYTMKNINQENDTYKHASNDLVFKLPNDLLYYVQGQLQRDAKSIQSIDKLNHLFENITLIDHNSASSYKASDSNLPWIKTPVSYLEGNNVHVLVDSYKLRNDVFDKLTVTYLKKPSKFVDNGGIIDTDSSSPTYGKFIINTSKLNSSDKLG